MVSTRAHGKSHIDPSSSCQILTSCLGSWAQYYNKDIEAGFEASSLFQPQHAQTPEPARKPASKRGRDEGVATRCCISTDLYLLKRLRDASSKLCISRQPA